MSIETIEIDNSSGKQVINIPDSFKIDDDKVYVKKVGNALFLIPFHNPWKSMLESINEFSEDFMNDREQENHQARELFD